MSLSEKEIKQALESITLPRSAYVILARKAKAKKRNITRGQFGEKIRSALFEVDVIETHIFNAEQHKDPGSLQYYTSRGFEVIKTFLPEITDTSYYATKPEKDTLAQLRSFVETIKNAVVGKSFTTERDALLAKIAELEGEKKKGNKKEVKQDEQ